MWPPRKTRPGSRPAQAHYAVLRRESRPRRWALAVTVGAVIGWVVGVLLGWWLGPFVAAVIVIGLLIWDRRCGGLAGWPGDQGCHRLAAAAALLEQRGWVVLRTPTIANQDPGRTAYLLIGRGGVFVVEHQIWPAVEKVTTSPSSGLLEVAGRPVARRTAAVRAAAAAVDEALSDALSREIPVHPVLAIHGLALDRPHTTVGVTILPIADLARVIHASRVLLSGTEVDAIAAAARRLFGPGAWP